MTEGLAAQALATTHLADDDCGVVLIHSGSSLGILRLQLLQTGPATLNGLTASYSCLVGWWLHQLLFRSGWLLVGFHAPPAKPHAPGSDRTRERRTQPNEGGKRQRGRLKDT